MSRSENRLSSIQSPQNHPIAVDHQELNRSTLGALGEQYSAQYLTNQGYEIEALNWRGKTGELDIVARIGTQLVFIEVRTRSSTWLARTSEAVTPSKQRQVARCADEYLRSRSNDAPNYDVVRFDVIGVLLTTASNQSMIEIDHEVGAFCSPWAY